MKELTLVRSVLLPEVTLGVLQLGKFIFSTLELPYRDNQRNISSIPEGSYDVFLNPKNTYELKDVPERGGIQIHVGNIVSDIRGCILLGLRFGTLQNQFAVLNSAAAIQVFKNELRHEDFRLIIKSVK